MLLSRLRVSPAVAIAIADGSRLRFVRKSSTQDGGDKGAVEPAIRSRDGSGNPPRELGAERGTRLDRAPRAG
jgi:hypothetical protein